MIILSSNNYILNRLYFIVKKPKKSHFPKHYIYYNRIEMIKSIIRKSHTIDTIDTKIRDENEKS